MDPVTHGLIGASAAQTASSENTIRTASLAGFFSALLADLDVFISDPADPLLNLEIHRQFSHSLIFIPVGALIATGLLWWFMQNRLSFKELYIYSILGYATSGLADTLTSYGTKLLWPFWDERFALNLISVFDPLFSLGILAAVIFAFYQRKLYLSGFAWGWIACYLIFAMVQQNRAQIIAENLAKQRNHHIERLVVKPTIANQLLWSTRYISSDSLFADGIQLTPFVNPKIYEGESAELLDWQQKYQSYKGSTLYNDIRRFSALSEGYLIEHPHQEHVIGDGRYAMLPTVMNPLWGIKIDTAHADQHLPFKTYRDPNKKVRDTYINMLLGKPIE